MDQQQGNQQPPAGAQPQQHQAPQPQPQQPPQQQQPYQPPMPQPQPIYAPAPLLQLTGGMKFGWFLVGTFLGIGGILIAWLTSADKVPQVKNDAIKFTVIGVVIWIVLGFVLALGLSSCVALLASSSGYYY